MQEPHSENFPFTRLKYSLLSYKRWWAILDVLHQNIFRRPILKYSLQHLIPMRAVRAKMLRKLWVTFLPGNASRTVWNTGHPSAWNVRYLFILKLTCFNTRNNAICKVEFDSTPDISVAFCWLEKWLVTSKKTFLICLLKVSLKGIKTVQ